MMRGKYFRVYFHLVYLVIFYGQLLKLLFFFFFFFFILYIYCKLSTLHLTVSVFVICIYLFIMFLFFLLFHFLPFLSFYFSLNFYKPIPTNVHCMAEISKRFSKKLQIQISIAIWWNQHEKCIKMSTNKPSIGPVMKQPLEYEQFSKNYNFVLKFWTQHQKQRTLFNSYSSVLHIHSKHLSSTHTVTQHQSSAVVNWLIWSSKTNSI